MKKIICAFAALIGFSTSVSATPVGYLTQSSATVTYLQQSSATATYLQLSSATATYLTQSSATVTYTKGSLAAGGVGFGSTTGTIKTDADYFHYRPTTFELVVGTNSTTATSAFSGGGRFYRRTSTAISARPLISLNPFNNTYSGLSSDIFDASSGATPYDGTDASFSFTHSSFGAVNFTNSYQTSNSGNYLFSGVGGDNYANFTTSGISLSKNVAITSPFTLTVDSANVSGQMTVGTLQGAALSSCGDGTHALGWGSGSFSCQSITGTGSGGSSALAVAISSVAISSPTAGINFSAAFTGGLTSPATAQIGLSGSSVTLQGNGITFTTLGIATGTLRTDVTALGVATATFITASSVTATYVSLTGTQTISGFDTFSSSAGLAVTYGITAGSFTSSGSGAGGLILTEGSSSTVNASVASGKDVFWADSGSHTFVFNPNATSSYTVVGSSTNPTIGHIATWSSQFGLIDGGAAGAGTITQVIAGTGLTGGGSSGAVTLTAGTTTAFLTSTQTFTATQTFASSNTFSGQINISSNVQLSGVSGTNGQVFTSGGVGTVPTWTTISASGGGYALEPATVTIQGNKGVTMSTGTVYMTTTSTLAFVVKSTTTLTLLAVDNTLPVAGDYLVSVSTMPGGSGPMAFGVNTYGHVVSSGTSPAVSSCGTSPSINANATDFAGTINVGSVTATSCVLTFANPFANIPTCTVSDDSTGVTADISTISASAVTFGFSISLAGGHVYYICVGTKG